MNDEPGYSRENPEFGPGDVLRSTCHAYPMGPSLSGTPGIPVGTEVFVDDMRWTTRWRVMIGGGFYSVKDFELVRRAERAD